MNCWKMEIDFANHTAYGEPAPPAQIKLEFPIRVDGGLDLGFVARVHSDAEAAPYIAGHLGKEDVFELYRFLGQAIRQYETISPLER